MLEMKCKIFVTTNIKEARLERDNMLKEAREMKRWLLMLK
jgi:hypothetical protein